MLSAFALTILDDKAVNSTINFLNTQINILLYLLITYCFVQECVYQQSTLSSSSSSGLLATTSLSGQ